MTTLRIEGLPLVSFEFSYIPSWNEVIAWANARPRRVHSHAQARVILNTHIDHWRKIGCDLAQEFMWEMVWNTRPFDYLITNRALVLVKVLRDTKRTYDVHNVWLKALLDGFTDASIWPNDSWPHVPMVITTWWPYDGQGQRFIIEVHPLTTFMYNERVILLPMGATG